jgi:TP901 family phage tail tape measure protein
MALDYNDAFTKIAAISNASAGEIAKWKEEVLDLAGETAKSPKELADALFFLASAGLKSSQIMPALEASAKGAAVGLGETADVANIVASTLNAYAGAGLKAAQVTDTLVAAVREGRAEPQEFATALGRILPIASAAGISFSDVAASLAGLSNIGLDVNEGVTAMRGLFQALVAPTDTAATAMKGVGLSAQDLLDSLQQDGLIATIRMLDSAVKKNTGSQSEYMGVLRDIVPNVRSLTGLLGLTTQEAERVNSVFNRVRESTGSLGEAMATTAESPGFKLRQAITELGVAMIQLGDIIIPALVAVVEFIQENWTPAWKALSDTVTDAWKAIQPFAEAIGNVLIPLFTKAFQIIQNNVLPALGRLKPIFVVIGAAVALFATVVLAQFALVITAVGLVIDWVSRIVQAFMKVVAWVRGNLAEPIIGALQRVGDFIGQVAGWIKDRFLGAWNAIKAPVLAIIGSFIAAIQTLIGWIQDAIGFIQQLGQGVSQALAERGAAAGVFSGVRPIPEAATGGFVARSGLAVIHQGENIVPAGGGGGGDIIFQIDGQTFARISRDQLLQMKGSRGGTLGLA